MPGDFNWAGIQYRLSKGWSPKQFGGGKTLQNQLYFLNRYGPAAMGMWRGPTDEMDPNAKGGFKPEKGTWYGVQLPQSKAISGYMAWYDQFRKAGGKHDDALRAFMVQNPQGQLGGTKFNYTFKGLPYYKNRFFESYTGTGFNPFEKKMYNAEALLSQAGGNLQEAANLVRQGQSQGTIPIQDLAQWQQANPDLPPPPAGGQAGVPQGGMQQQPPGAPGAPGQPGMPGQVPGGPPPAAQALQGAQQNLGMAMGTTPPMGTQTGQPGSLNDLMDNVAYRNMRSFYSSPQPKATDVINYGKGTGAFAWGGAPKDIFTPTQSWRNAPAPQAQPNLGQHLDSFARSNLEPPVAGGLPGGGINPWGSPQGGGGMARPKNQYQFQLGGPRQLGGMGRQAQPTPYQY